MMEANARNLERIFDSTVSYQIPLFQRPYVWNEQDNWAPLWEDILSLLNRRHCHGSSRPHFLGAVVLEQLNHASGSIETRQVIDGQQRFTTLQLFMIAARDLCKQIDNVKYYECFKDMVSNKEKKVDHAYEVFKIWPTNCDRPAFELVHKSGSVKSLNDALIANLKLAKENHQIISGYKYFFSRLSEWVNGSHENEEQSTSDGSLEDRLECLWQVVRDGLKLVVIDLDNDDESQVIFETLNARGTQLLPADLVKNYLFRKAQSESQKVEQLYENYWRDFDSNFWRKEEKQGRFKRPRIDLFLQHYLTLMTRDDIRTSHIFESFKDYVTYLEVEALSNKSTKNSLTTHATDTKTHLEVLSRYAKAFANFKSAPSDSRLSIFIGRLSAIDTATVYPLLLLASDQLLPNNEKEFEEFVCVIESFLMRRMICCLTTKNYNQLFISAIRALDKSGSVTANGLSKFLKSNQGDSVRFPDDQEVKASIKQIPLYQKLSQLKVRTILGALDLALHDPKSERLPLPSNLTIEHVMPIAWATYWVIPKQIANDPAKKIEFVAERNQMIHTLGNLTLITGSLNPALSNGSWKDKRSELQKFSKLNLNRYFHVPNGNSGTDPMADWDESTISIRCDELSTAAIKIWIY